MLSAPASHAPSWGYTCLGSNLRHFRRSRNLETLVVFGTVTFGANTDPSAAKPSTPAQQQVTVICDGLGAAEDPCDTLNAPDAGNGACCVPVSQSQQFEDLCNAQVGMEFLKLTDGLTVKSSHPCFIAEKQINNLKIAFAFPAQLQLHPSIDSPTVSCLRSIGLPYSQLFKTFHTSPNTD
ncbi:hypothetical protein LX32DRAFT_650947 [Colletotrichum zoysiae]|uniref:Hydrophobin n=1 Tax=Colletotrichum zoysiae TaxID=1216348 RepID=A0AAD9M6W9_9PEZI|nr:hypothetical protein LX32DRAFT_650947 [Colletotrichum zoysiae]